MEMWLIKLVFGLLISFLMTFYLVPIVIKIATRFGILDNPDGKIKNHKQPTPYLGGVAVYMGFILSLALVFPFANQLFLFLIGVTLLLFVGLIDDLIVTKPYQKFFGQIIAALCFLKAGFHAKEMFFLHNLWNAPLSLFWILLITNAFNLVDVMDGLSSTLAIQATVAFLLIAIGFGQTDVALLLACFLGPLIAFLFYNKPKAAIYLGDAGALFIGGFLAIIPFLFNWGTYNWYGFLTPFIILAVPLLEVGTLIIIRTYKGIPFYNGSPDHFSIYMKNNGWSVVAILKYLGCISIFLCTVSCMFVFNKLTLLSTLILLILFLIQWFFVVLHKKNEAKKGVFTGLP